MAPLMTRLLEEIVPKRDPVFKLPRPEPPESDVQVWRARCSACEFVSEGTEKITRHNGLSHRKETGHYVWVCFDLLGVGVGWL